MEEKPRGTENMGRIESMAKLLMKTWEGITENHDLPKNRGFPLSSGEYVVNYFFIEPKKNN